MPLQVIKPGDENQQVSNSITIFLAGSIEMGSAKNWQSEVEEYLKNKSVTIFNPRRESWDSSWVQRQSNPTFNEQVNWEMNRLEEANIIFMNFIAETKSPITLLELGAHLNDGKLIVCCPEEFWRVGNVEIVCTRNNIPFFYKMEDALGALETKISQYERD